MAQADAHALVVAQLREQLQRLEGAGRPRDAAAIGTGIEAFDALLPGGGWSPGSLIEWLADEGSGAATLALHLTQTALNEEGALIVIDDQHSFYPPALSPALLERLVLVRPTCREDAWWALEQSLRCRGVARSLCWLDACDALVLRRLQLAAEVGTGLGLLVRPLRVRGQPSWADVRLLVQPASGRRWRLEILACRGGRNGGVIELEAADETHPVPLAAPLAPATSVRSQESGVRGQESGVRNQSTAGERGA